MRKLFLLAVAFAFSGIGLALAAEEKTYTGDAVCAKCALKETADCQNTVTVKEDGKDVTYYLEGDASTKVHKSLGICGASKASPIKVKVTGTVSEKDGKKVIEVSKMEKAA
jgi:Family of unknown function (DUF6370)